MKELNSVNGIYSARMIGQHLMLKAVSLGVTTPFLSASLIETVQSDIACEKPGILDVFKVNYPKYSKKFSQISICSFRLDDNRISSGS